MARRHEHRHGAAGKPDGVKKRTKAATSAVEHSFHGVEQKPSEIQSTAPSAAAPAASDPGTAHAPQEQQQLQGGAVGTKRTPHALNPQRRKRLKLQHQQEVPADEARRRQEQRRLRELALTLRQKGASYDPKVMKRKRLRQAANKAAKAGGGDRSERRKQTKERRKGGTHVQVLVLPIYWQERAEERERVLSAAQGVHALLSAAGLAAEVDDGNNFTPGQKMKHWETLGVKVRLEIGPKEALAGSCVLAMANAPGEVAARSGVKVGEGLVPRVLAALREAGVQPRIGEAPPAGGAPAGGGGAREQGGTAGDDGVVTAKQRRKLKRQELQASKAKAASAGAAPEAGAAPAPAAGAAAAQVLESQIGGAEGAALTAKERRKLKRQQQQVASGAGAGAAAPADGMAQPSAEAVGASAGGGTAGALTASERRKLKRQQREELGGGAADVEAAAGQVQARVAAGAAEADEAATAGLLTKMNGAPAAAPATAAPAAAAAAAAAAAPAAGEGRLQPQPAVQVQQQPARPGSQQQQQYLSGDALEDDFGFIAVEAEEGAMLGSKKRKLKGRKGIAQAAATNGMGGNEGLLAAAALSGGARWQEDRKKLHKMVKF